MLLEASADANVGYHEEIEGNGATDAILPFQIVLLSGMYHAHNSRSVVNSDTHFQEKAYDIARKLLLWHQMNGDAEFAAITHIHVACILQLEEEVARLVSTTGSNSAGADVLNAPMSWLGLHEDGQIVTAATLLTCKSLFKKSVFVLSGRRGGLQKLPLMKNFIPKLRNLLPIINLDLHTEVDRAKRLNIDRNENEMAPSRDGQIGNNGNSYNEEDCGISMSKKGVRGEHRRKTRLRSLLPGRRARGAKLNQGAASVSIAIRGYEKKTPLRVDSPSVQLVQEANTSSRVNGWYKSQLPLSFTVRERDEATVKLLLDQGAEVDCSTTDHHEGRTPLSFAAETGHEAIVKLLLDYGANTDFKATGRYDGWTPLNFAVMEEHEFIVELLLNDGADANAHLVSGWQSRTPLSFAAERGQNAIVKLLLHHGAKTEKTTDFEQGQTPLSFAATRGHKVITKILLNHGANINSMATGYHEGRTPLSFAADMKHIAVVKQLLDEGANISLSATELMWPSSLPWNWKKNPIMTKLLDDYSLSEMTSSNEGWTLLRFAVEFGHEAIVELLLRHKANTDSGAKGSYRVPPVSCTNAEAACDDKILSLMELRHEETIHQPWE